MASTIVKLSALLDAVVEGNDRTLNRLLDKLDAETSQDQVNCVASQYGGYTLLHIAASSGYAQCVRVLLQHGADIYAQDEFGRTPYESAQLGGKHSVIRLLRSEEIVREVDSNGERVTDLLRFNVDQLEPGCLPRALVAATRNDNPVNVGKLVIKGAYNLDQCMEIAISERKPHCQAMLLLLKAAVTGNKSIVEKLFGDAVSDPGSLDPREICDDQFAEVQKAILSGTVSTVVPIEIARRNGNSKLREELLMKTDVDEEEGKVFWHGLRLLSLDISLLRRITWVKRLRLARNGLKSLPQELGQCLKQVVKLDLQHNDLRHIPHSLLELPNLAELNLAHNFLDEIPDVVEWSPCLTVVDLSHNELRSLPDGIIAPSIKALNLSYNQFQCVPLCISFFTTLHTLNISENPDIRQLPAEMGLLQQLSQLGVNGLNNLRDPPKNIVKDAQSCVRYLNGKLRNSKSFFKMKLVLGGQAKCGKTTLVERLQGKRIGENPATHVDMYEWSCKPGLGKSKFQFNVWELGGFELCPTLQRCFMSDNSVYLLLFNLKYKRRGVQELEPWLKNLSFQAPGSLVIIIGTHHDELDEEERAEIDQTLTDAKSLASAYSSSLKIAEILLVGLAGRRDVGILKNAIYNHTAAYTTSRGHVIMGQKVPASYHCLHNHFEAITDEVRKGDRNPIMHIDEFKQILMQTNLPDVFDEEEQKILISFLVEKGLILHYDDKSHDLNELYFLDPKWFCDTVMNIVAAAQKSAQGGIVCTEDIILLFRKEKFLSKYDKQCVAFLNRFEIALPLDDRRLLVLSTLPIRRPSEVDEEISKRPLYTRFIIFKQATTPPGFWSRLLSRVIHTVHKVAEALDVCPSPSCLHGLLEAPPSQEEPLQGESMPIYSAAGSHQLHCWQEGMFFRNASVTFQVESLASLSPSSAQDGALVRASLNSEGRRVAAHLVNTALGLIDAWYPGMSVQNGGVEQRVFCLECVKSGNQDPHEFKVEQCLRMIFKNETHIECKSGSEENHMVALSDIVPDLLLKDTNAKLLSENQLKYEKNEASLIVKGRFGKVYHGMYNGRNVAIKKYVIKSEDVFSELRSEAKILQHLEHPCIVFLEGVSLHPTMALVLRVDAAPLGLLSSVLLNEQTPVHRLTVFRIASEVAAALTYLHKRGIVHGSVTTNSVLCLTLNPHCLIHCKLADFNTATHHSPSGARGPKGTRGFVAPEMLCSDRRHPLLMYNHKADIFSFAMFLYQMVAGRDPYHNKPGHKVNACVASGARPKLVDVDQAHFKYYHLTELMKACWRHRASDRPDDGAIIKQLSHSTMQSTMAVVPINNNPAHKAVGILSGHHPEPQLWLSSNSADSTEINIYTRSTMAKVRKLVIKNCIVQTIVQCGGYVWVGSNENGHCSNVDVFSSRTMELVHHIRMKETAVSCMTCTDDAVYIGTPEGFCFRFASDLDQVRANATPRYKFVSNNAVDGIACTQQCMWVSHSRYLSLINFDTLHLEASITWDKEGHIGQLSLSPDGTTVWSGHLGGFILTAWDVQKQCHRLDIDTRDYMAAVTDVSCDIPMKGRTVTTVVPARDCVWVGMATGHILVFHDTELVTWFHPYTEAVSFLTAFPSTDSTECVMASGGRGFQSIIEDAKTVEKVQEDGLPNSQGECLVVWEAFTSKTYRQMKLIEGNVSFDNSQFRVSQMITQGGFDDDTLILNALRQDDASCQGNGATLSDHDKTAGDIAIEKLPFTSPLPTQDTNPSHQPHDTNPDPALSANTDLQLVTDSSTVLGHDVNIDCTQNTDTIGKSNDN